MKALPKSSVAFIAGFLFVSLYSHPVFAQNTASSNSKSSLSSPESRPPPGKWIPEDVDDAVPQVAADVSCSLPDVLSRAGKRVQELVENVDRFTATEVLIHRPVDRLGRTGRATTIKFDYLVSISTVRDGFFSVQEFRNQSRSLDLFPSHIATTGTPSLALIFHPRYVGDFQTKCEGLGSWNGQPAWQVRFEQRSDRPNRTSAFIVNGRNYSGDLRGRAWILADSYQIGRLETDTRQPIPQIRLRRDHQSIEYGPVTFPGNNLRLWLPSSAELYMDFRGRRFYRRHSFTDFKLFSVDTQYQVGDPKGIDTSQIPAR